MTNVQFDRDSTTLLTGSNDGQLRLWDLTSGKLIQFLNAHQSDVMKCGFNFLGNQIVSGSSDKLVKVWDRRQMAEPIMVFEENTDEVPLISK